MLSVRRGPEAVDFYKRAFGATEAFRFDGDDGKSVVARLSVSGAEFWVADESPEHKNYSPETLGGGTVRMILVVEDPDAAFDRAVGAGAQVVQAMEITTAGGSDAWSIRTGTTGKSVNRSKKAFNHFRLQSGPLLVRNSDCGA
jgi:PhnB protein